MKKFSGGANEIFMDALFVGIIIIFLWGGKACIMQGIQKQDIMDYVCAAVLFLLLAVLFVPLVRFHVFDLLCGIITLSEEGVRLQRLFYPTLYIKYTDFERIGIGVFLDGRNGHGFKRGQIFFTKEYYKEKYRYNINMLNSSDKTIKMAFRQDVYDYLVKVLPLKKCTDIQKDYDIFRNSPKYMG